jgi:gamma-glutamyl:cysteine ligase YbdK (ATP-grasp superfamily)
MCPEPPARPQVSIAQHELVPFTNMGNLAAPVVIALCANSSVYHGTRAGVCSARETLMSRTYGNEDRYGMIGALPQPNSPTTSARLQR